MATIQIRNVPDAVHRKWRERAGRAGMSLQEYLLADLVRRAGSKTPQEIEDEVRAEMRAHPERFFQGSSADIIREDRESH